MMKNKINFFKSVKILNCLIIIFLIIVIGVNIEVLLSRSEIKTQYPAEESMENQNVVKEEAKTDDMKNNDIEGKDSEDRIKGNDLKENKENSKESIRAIACWGDSMIEGIGKGEAIIYTQNGQKDISYYNTPQTIQELTSMDTYNFGVSGETSYEIAVRAGGIPIYTDRDIRINNYSGTNISFVDETGKVVYMEDYSGFGNECKDYTDTVIINNRFCQIKRDYYTGELWILLCSNDDETEEVEYEEMYIPKKTVVIPRAAFEHRNDILILEMGSNGGWNNYQELITQYQRIIDFCECSDYIIVGDTDDPDWTFEMGNSDFLFEEENPDFLFGEENVDFLFKEENPNFSFGEENIDFSFEEENSTLPFEMENRNRFDENEENIGMNDTKWEAALRAAFGNHFLNTRTYLIENGLSDCGLVQTWEDRTDAQMGFISAQLRADWTHFNSYGYYSKGKAIYLKGIELGYWD